MTVGCSVLKPRPVSEQVYNFNDLDRMVDVEYGSEEGLIAQAARIKNTLGDRLPHIPGLPRSTDPVVQQRAVATSVDYLAKNGLHDAKVRVNQYAPVSELKRLKNANTVAAPLRYTLGVASVTKYALLPGPLLKRDSYNPYTHTLNLNSGVAAAGVEQAAHAKDLRNRRVPNLYLLAKRAPGGELPGIAYTHKEVVNYFAMYGSPQDCHQAQAVMLPRLASQVAGEIGDFIPGTRVPLKLAGRILGKAIVLAR